jgi:hypothetical protein
MTHDFEWRGGYDRPASDPCGKAQEVVLPLSGVIEQDCVYDLRIKLPGTDRRQQRLFIATQIHPTCIAQKNISAHAMLRNEPHSTQIQTRDQAALENWVTTLSIESRVLCPMSVVDLLYWSSTRTALRAPSCHALFSRAFSRAADACAACCVSVRMYADVSPCDVLLTITDDHDHYCETHHTS